MRSRAEALTKIAGNRFDVCVVGGGATGAACALDAQLRGLSTVLVEAGDFAGATSSAATKIVHGGVRYLEEAVRSLDVRNYKVLRQALRERARMLHNAPHLTRRIEFLVPCYRWSEIIYFGIGLKIYDWLAGRARISPSKLLAKNQTLRRMRALKSAGLKGSIAYADGQFDDARYNLALVQSFCRSSGEALNHARVVEFIRRNDGKLSGVHVRNELSGEVLQVEATVIVNATGPFSDTIRRLATPSLEARMRPSKGSHILLPLEIFPAEEALLVPKTDDGRVLFVVPWNGRLLVGTTEEEISADSELALTEKDVEYLLRHVNRYVAVQITPNDIVSGFAGARPLVATEDNAGRTKSLARDDVIEVDALSGLISIMGGKWTTHRAMAEETVNRVQQALGTQVSPSRTRDYFLSGGQDFTEVYWKKLCAEYALPEATARHLAAKFGTDSERILDLAREYPALAEPVICDFPAVRAEVIYAARYELASKVEDVMARRLGLQFYSWRMAMEAAPVVADLLAAELGWSKEEREAAVSSYARQVHHWMETAGLEQ